jgi:hypothetical protein
MREPSQNELSIRDAVTEHYLATGKPADTKELADCLGWSVTKVRRIINDECHGAAVGTNPCQETRESYSMSYGNIATGGHRVWVYYPTLWHLRDLVLNAKGRE